LNFIKSLRRFAYSSRNNYGVKTSEIWPQFSTQPLYFHNEATHLKSKIKVWSIDDRHCPPQNSVQLGSFDSEKKCHEGGP